MLATKFSPLVRTVEGRKVCDGLDISIAEGEAIWSL